MKMIQNHNIFDECPYLNAFFVLSFITIIILKFMFQYVKITNYDIYDLLLIIYYVNHKSGSFTPINGFLDGSTRFVLNQ